jgi:hypothetical protein
MEDVFLFCGGFLGLLDCPERDMEEEKLEMEE